MGYPKKIIQLLDWDFPMEIVTIQLLGTMTMETPEVQFQNNPLGAPDPTGRGSYRSCIPKIHQVYVSVYIYNIMYNIYNIMYIQLMYIYIYKIHTYTI